MVMRANYRNLICNTIATSYQVNLQCRSLTRNPSYFSFPGVSKSRNFILSPPLSRELFVITWERDIVLQNETRCIHTFNTV